jgi:hypothetical protein
MKEPEHGSDNDRADKDNGAERRQGTKTEGLGEQLLDPGNARRIRLAIFRHT